MVGGCDGGGEYDGGGGECDGQQPCTAAMHGELYRRNDRL